MLPSCTVNGVLESTSAANVSDGRRATRLLSRSDGSESGEGAARSPAAATLSSCTAGEGHYLDAARGIAMGCAAGVVCWLLLGALVYWLV
jgi:hypothetical protein